eukprot:1683269-Amphidinium_carterae.1
MSKCQILQKLPCSPPTLPCLSPLKGDAAHDQVCSPNYACWTHQSKCNKLPRFSPKVATACTLSGLSRIGYQQK